MCVDCSISVIQVISGQVRSGQEDSTYRDEFDTETIKFFRSEFRDNYFKTFSCKVRVYNFQLISNSIFSEERENKKGKTRKTNRKKFLFPAFQRDDQIISIQMQIPRVCNKGSVEEAWISRKFWAEITLNTWDPREKTSRAAKMWPFP